MPVEIRQIAAEQLPEYAAVPIRFTVDTILRVEAVGDGLGGLSLLEEKVDPPYLKDYDAQGSGEEGPESWPGQFDLSHWGLFLAVEGGQAVGGVAVAMDAPDVHVLERCSDLAVLWDIRVHPEERGRGIGTALFRHAAGWARAQGCHQLKIETRNVNVRACRFYAAQGCTLGSIHRYGYAGCLDVAHETMLLWYLDLRRSNS